MPGELMVLIGVLLPVVMVILYLAYDQWKNL